MPDQFNARTITQVSVEQAAAGSVDLAAAPGADLRIYVVVAVLVCAAAGGGTVKFTEGTGPTDLTGVIPLAANGGFVVLGDGITPIISTNTANSKLSLTSATNGVHGWIRYFVDI